MLAALNPLTYSVDLLRDLLDVAVIVAFAAAALSAATYAFTHQE